MKKTSLTYKIVALLSLSALVLFGFQNCGELKVAKYSASSEGYNTASTPYLSPATTLYSFTGESGAKQALPVQQFELGDGIINASLANSLANAGKIKTLTTAASVVKWPNGEIPFFFDPNSGFTAAEVATLRTNLLAACNRWSQLAGVKCTELTSASPALATNSVLPYLVVTQSNVPLPWVSNPAGFCSSGSSCTTIGYAGNNGVSHYAIHKTLINNMWNLTHELGHALGLFHEHQRPGRDSFISIRQDKLNDGNYAIIPILNAVNNDYDYASVMHYYTVGSRNADYLTGVGSFYMAFRTGPQYQSFTHMHRSALNFSAGSRGLAVNLPGYPSIQDSDNARALYGPPAVTNQPCQLSGGQRAIPHGARIGIFTSQGPATTTNGFCDVEPRLCVNGTLTGGDGLEHFSTCNTRCKIAGADYDYAAKATYYTISSGTQAQCDASRVELFCDVLVMLAPVAGFATCSTTAAVTSCPLPLQKTVVSAANNVGATNTCVFNLTTTNAGSTASVTSSVAGSSYSLLCQSNSQWATAPTGSLCPAPAAGILKCPDIIKTVVSAPNNVGATNTCTFNISSTNASVLANATSNVTGSSYALMCQSNAVWATTATSSICPSPAPGIVTCAAIQKTMTSAANASGATNTCIFDFAATTANTTVTANSSVAGSSYTLPCLSTGQWATSPTASVCPMPAAINNSCPLPFQKTITSAANSAGSTNTCVFNLTSTTGGATSTVSSPVAGSSYSLLCESNLQWATTPTSSVCPAPANVSTACPLPLQRSVTSAANTSGATNTCVFNLTSTAAGSTSTVSSPIAGSSYSLLCQSNSQWAATPTSSVCPAPANVASTNCGSQAVPLLCSINGSVRTIMAQLNLNAPAGTFTSEMTNQSNMGSIVFSDPPVDFSKSYGFKLQWACNSTGQWQFTHPNGNCNFQSVYNSAGGATCERYYYSPNECTCTDNIGGTRVFPFVGEVSHTVCEGGESGYCYQVIDTPGTCDGKIPVYIPQPETGGN